MVGADAEPVEDERAELRASRMRLVLAADAEHREIERELHGVVQQHFVALGVNLQLAAQAVDTDPAAAKELLAQRIHPPLLEADLAVALRSALGAAAIPVTVDVAAGSAYQRHVALTCYFVCLEAVARTVGTERAAVTVRDERERVDVEVVLTGGQGPPELAGLVDRVQALGGSLTTSSGEDGARVLASLPVSR